MATRKGRGGRDRVTICGSGTPRAAGPRSFDRMSRLSDDARDDPSDGGAHEDVRGGVPAPARRRRPRSQPHGGAGRDLRVRRTERRRQDDDHQDADGAHPPDAREGVHLRRADPEPGGEGADRVPPGAPRLLRVPLRARGAAPLRGARRGPPRRARGPVRLAARARRARRGGGPPGPEVLEGHAAAARDRAGARRRPRVRGPRRADERARPGRPQGHARPHPRPEAPGGRRSSSRPTSSPTSRRCATASASSSAGRCETSASSPTCSPRG